MLSFVLLLIVIAMLTCIVISYKTKQNRVVRMVNKFNGPKTIPFFGNAFFFLCSPEVALQKALKLKDEYGGPVRMWLFHKPLVAIFNPEDLQILMNRELEKGDSYFIVSNLLGDGLLTSKVEKWKLHRRIINPTLHRPSLLKQFTKIFHRHSLRMVKKLEKEVGIDDMVDIWPYVLSTSLCTICETAMGLDTENDHEVLEFGEAIIYSSQLIMHRVTRPWLYPSFIFSLWKNTVQDYKKTRNVMESFPSKILKLKREEMKIQKLKSNEDEEDCSHNFLDSLLHSSEVEKHFSDKDIMDEIIIIIIGGSETGAITMGFLLLMLAMHPDIQDIVYNEIYNVFGETNRPPDFEDLRMLPYLEQCIKETLRRFTVVPVMSRKLNQDLELSDGNVIPQGIELIISPIAVHRDPANYSNPLIWNPKNFDADVELNRHKCAFIPFSFGPRGCIGSKYAIIVMKEQASTVLRNYRISTKITMEDLVDTVDIMCRSKHGYPIQLEYRNGKSIF